MGRRTLRIGGWRTGAVLATVAIGALTLFAAYRQECAANFALLEERGQTILDALTASIRMQTHLGRYRAERIREAFGSLAATPGVIALELRTLNGALIVAQGTTGRIPPAPGNKSYHEGTLVLRSPAIAVEGGPGPGAGRGRGQGAGRGRSEAGECGGAPQSGAWTPWQGGEVVLSIALDAEAAERRNRGVRMRYTGLGAMLALAGGMALWIDNRRRRITLALTRAEERAAQQAQLAQLGAGLAHETKNPLGLVRGHAQTILDDPGVDPAIREHARQIVDEADRIVGQINGFLGLARPVEARPGRTAMEGLTADLFALVKQEAEERGVRLTAATGGAVVEADADLLRRALLNLIINALQACDAGGEIAVETRGRGHAVEIVVRDTGRGIAEEDLPQVTRPYFTKTAGGAGLGLAIVEGIAKAHGWRIKIVSRPGEGTSVWLRDVHMAE